MFRCETHYNVVKEETYKVECNIKLENVCGKGDVYHPPPGDGGYHPPLEAGGYGGGVRSCYPVPRRKDILCNGN